MFDESLSNDLMSRVAEEEQDFARGAAALTWSWLFLLQRRPAAELNAMYDDIQHATTSTADKRPQELFLLACKARAIELLLKRLNA